jgi:hypothetical protein
MFSQAPAATEDLVELTRRVAGARGLIAVVLAQHELEGALRRALVSRQWTHLDEARRELQGSPGLEARLTDTLRSVLEKPELSARDHGARWHGLVLAIPATITSRAGILAFLPEPLALAFRESLQARFPPGTGIRLANRLVPQLVAHAMGAQALHALVEELAAGEGGAASGAGSEPTSAFVSHGRSLGQHYLFALVLTPNPAQLALEMPGSFQADPRLVKWAATQTEKITSDFAERGWPIVLRVSAPLRLREMLASPPSLSDVRELDGLLAHVADQHGSPVTMLRVELTPGRSEEPGLCITIHDRSAGTSLAQAFYRLTGRGAEAGAYRVAVRLASAGVELLAADETLLRVVQRAIGLTNEAPPPELPRDGVEPRRVGARTFRSAFSRSPRHPT